MDDIRAALAATDLFKGLSAGTLDRLVAVAVRRELPAGTHLFRQGEARRAAWVLVEGQIEIGRETAEGPERLLVMGPGQATGEGSLLRASHHSSSARRLCTP